jgi:hypothetical protein
VDIRGRIARLTLVAIMTAVGLVEWAPPSQAQFHLMRIKEVFGNHPAATDAEFVELQMYAPLQNQVGGHHLQLYSSTGTLVTDCTIPGNVSGSAPQATILFATMSAQTTFSVAPDFTFPPAISPSGGAVCFENIDCVSWGSFSGSTPSATGTPFAGGLPSLQSIVRRVSGGSNPTGLDEGDDTNNSNADFQAASPTPQNNGGTPTPRACTVSGSGDTAAPTSRISKPEQGASYGKLTRFRGSATDEGAGVDKVEIALRQKLSKGCAWWNGNRFAGGGCGAKLFIEASGDRSWSYKVKKPLPDSDTGKVKSYTLYARSTDTAGNEESSFNSGRNANRFEVG